MVWGPSFGETPGYPFADLASDYHWTWYDSFSTGAENWVMLHNPNEQPVYYEITIGGGAPGPGSSGTIQAGASIFSSFPDRIGGPVEVKAWTDETRTQPARVTASQRVLWNGHFNEVMGTVLETP